MLKEKIGVVLLALGVMSADSECLIVPILMALTGAFLMMRAEKTRRGNE